MINPAAAQRKNRFSTSLQTRMILLVCLLSLSLTLVAGGMYTFMIDALANSQLLIT